MTMTCQQGALAKSVSSTHVCLKCTAILQADVPAVNTVVHPLHQAISLYKLSIAGGKSMIQGDYKDTRAPTVQAGAHVHHHL